MSVLLQVALASYTLVHLLLLASVAHGNVAGKRHDGSNMGWAAVGLVHNSLVFLLCVMILLRLVFVDGACGILYCMQYLFCKTWPIAIVNIMMIATIVQNRSSLLHHLCL